MAMRLKWLENWINSWTPTPKSAVVDDTYAKVAYEARFMHQPGRKSRESWENLSETAKQVWREVADSVIDAWEGIDPDE